MNAWEKYLLDAVHEWMSLFEIMECKMLISDFCRVFSIMLIIKYK